jgi:uncharacterized membrane protein
MDEKKTSTGLEPNIAGLLCYVVGWITGLIFFFVEKDNKFVRFHAMQSIIVFGSLSVLQIVLSILRSIIYSIVWRTASWSAALAVSGFFGVLSTLIWIATMVLWVLLMFKAYQNETFKLPIAGGIAEKQVGM